MTDTRYPLGLELRNCLFDFAVASEQLVVPPYTGGWWDRRKHFFLCRLQGSFKLTAGTAARPSKSSLVVSGVSQPHCGGGLVFGATRFLGELAGFCLRPERDFFLVARCGVRDLDGFVIAARVVFSSWFGQSRGS